MWILGLKGLIGPAMGRSSFVCGLGFMVNSVCLLFSQLVANQFRELFRELQHRLKNKNKQD